MSSLTTQEKNFADDYVFQYFHTSTDSGCMAVKAAVYAGYNVPADVTKAESLGRSLLENKGIRKYIDSEIERFRAILSSEQRRNLWEHISQFTAGTPEHNADYGNIINH